MSGNKKKIKPKYKIVIEGDDNADWIKRVNDGKYQEADLAAHEYAAKLEEERRKKEGQE